MRMHVCMSMHVCYMCVYAYIHTHALPNAYVHDCTHDHTHTYAHADVHGNSARIMENLLKDADYRAFVEEKRAATGSVWGHLAAEPLLWNGLSADGSERYVSARKVALYAIYLRHCGAQRGVQLGTMRKIADIVRRRAKAERMRESDAAEVPEPKVAKLPDVADGQVL